MERRPDGSWEIWDYKTSGIEGRSHEEIVRKAAYDIQLHFYVWAAGVVLDQPISSARVVFTALPQAPFFQTPAPPDGVERSVADLLSEMADVWDGPLSVYSPAYDIDLCKGCQCKELELC